VQDKPRGRKFILKVSWVSTLQLVGVGLFAGSFWLAGSGQFSEFHASVEPYRAKILIFILPCLAIVLLSSCFSRRRNTAFPALSIGLMLLVGALLGGTMTEAQNDHRYATQRNGPTDLVEISAVSPQIVARETWFSYLSLRDYLSGKEVKVSKPDAYWQRLEVFSDADLSIDPMYDWLAVPFREMNDLEVIFEGVLYKERKIFLVGFGDSYHYYTSPEADYLVVSQ